jgi:hypothetical protein
VYNFLGVLGSKKNITEGLHIFLQLFLQDSNNRNLARSQQLDSCKTPDAESAPRKAGKKKAHIYADTTQTKVKKDGEKTGEETGINRSKHSRSKSRLVQPYEQEPELIKHRVTPSRTKSVAQIVHFQKEAFLYELF